MIGHARIGAPHARAWGARQQSSREEAANWLSHGLGLLAALVAVPVLLGSAARRGDALTVAGAAVFGASAVMVFLASTLYHALPEGPAKRRWEVLDNAAVFLMIAGTYTPFTLGLLRGPLGWSLFAAVWTLAAVGVALTVLGDLRYPVATVGLCLAMGWLSLVMYRPLSIRIPVTGLGLIFEGGLAYTAGVAFYAARSLRYHHLYWHLLVLLGSCCHYLAIFWYAT